MWLKHQVDFKKAGITEVECPEFNEWAQTGEAESISLVYATGYLGNPASYYGHILLKINTPRNSAINDIENQTINFGAILSGNDGLVKYIAKGLLGGYEAGFSSTQYYHHTHNYGETELRDLWEYQLDLTRKEMELVLGHAWELLGEKYTYYFLNRNCAYRMAELLEIIDGVTLTQKTKLWSVPQAVLQDLAQQHRGGVPIIRSVGYIPSRQSRLYKRFDALSSEEKEIFGDIIRDPGHLNSASFENINVTQQQMLLDTLLDYYQYLIDSEDDALDQNQERYRLALVKRYQLPPGVVPIQFSSSDSPHEGRRPSYFQLGATYHSEFKEGFHIQVRPAFYDDLDSGNGHVKFAALSMMEIKLVAYDSGIEVRDLNIVKIESVNKSSTGLPGDRGHSWLMEIGAGSHSLDCQNCLTPKAKAARGYTRTLWRGLAVAGAYAGIGAQANYQNSGIAYGYTQFRLSGELSPKIRARLSTTYKDYFASSPHDGTVADVQIRYQLSNNTDLRLFIEKNKFYEGGLQMGFYW